MPSKFVLIIEELELEAPNEPILLLPLRLLLPPLPPTKPRARLPFPAPNNLAAADRTPLLALKLEGGAGGVDGAGLSLRLAIVTWSFKFNHHILSKMIMKLGSKYKID